MKTIKILKLVFILFFTLQIAGSVVLVSAPKLVRAADYEPLNFTAQVPDSPLPGVTTKVGSYSDQTGKMTSDLLAKYIAAFYNYGMAVAGILGAVVLMAGGVLWLTSAGSDTKIGQAKELITGSITGLVILFCSWIILNTVNPEILKFRPIEMTVIKKLSYCCDPTKGNVLMDSQGKCPTGSIQCDYGGGERCENGGAGDSNAFSCIKRNLEVNDAGEIVDVSGGNPDTRYFCCEYTWGTEKYCEVVNTGEKCKESHAWAGGNGPLTTSYASFCRTGYTKAANCIVNECANVDPGTSCADGYCYNNICWKGKGKEGEPCGNEPYSKCDKDEPQNGKTCNGDQGSRGCTSPLWCCKFNNNGSRINK